MSSEETVGSEETHFAFLGGFAGQELGLFELRGELLKKFPELPTNTAHAVVAKWLRSNGHRDRFNRQVS